MPGRWAVEAAWVRLDNISVLYERLQKGVQHVRCLMADSSSKLYNYFCCKEKKVVWPANDPLISSSGYSVATSIDVQTAEVGNFAWQPTVFGYAAASLAFKARNLIHSMVLKTDGEEHMLELRKSVTGWTSDQGTERKVGDVGFAHPPRLDDLKQAAFSIGNKNLVLQPPEGAPQMSYLFPFALTMPGHIHCLYNALEHAVKKSRLWSGSNAAFEQGIKSILALLNDKNLRTRFRKTCLGDAPKQISKLFKYWSIIHVDWRWETLTFLLNNLMPLIPVMVKRFDLRKLTAGHEGRSEIDVAIIGTLSSFLKLPWLEVGFEMLRVVSQTITLWAHWLEGCPCHEELLLEGGVKRFRKETGTKTMYFFWISWP